MTTNDPIDVLVEIMQIVTERMADKLRPPTPAESFTLGHIMGAAWSVPEAVQRYKKTIEADD